MISGLPLSWLAFPFSAQNKFFDRFRNPGRTGQGVLVKGAVNRVFFDSTHEMEVGVRLEMADPVLSLRSQL
jgi:hypothetical protein